MFIILIYLRNVKAQHFPIYQAEIVVEISSINIIFGLASHNNDQSDHFQ